MARFHIVLALVALSAAAPAALAQSLPEPPLISAPGGPELSRSRSLRFGILAGSGAPQPLGLEAFARFNDYFGAGFGIGLLPAPVGEALLAAAGQNGSLDSMAFEGELRLFPFRGAFYLGGALGHMGLSATGRSHGYPVAVDIGTIYAAPRFGWLGTWDSGFAIGLDLGVQVPISPDVTVKSDSPGQSYIESAARQLASSPLPTIALRMGFLL
jgi:hypothetical protein